MKISVCIDALLTDLAFADRMKAVRSAGADTFEFWTWWDKDLHEIRKVKDELGLNIAAFCTKFISLVDPSQRDKYIEGLQESLEAAKFLGSPMLITEPGNDIGYSREYQRKSIVDGLKTCAPLLDKSGVTLLVEPLNLHVDHAGCFLSSSIEGLSIIEEIGSPNVKLLYDIYHQQITEGNLIMNIIRNMDRIGHFHAAGHPGRHELYRGEINYPEVLKAIRETGYQGCVGLEYFPMDDPIASIKASMAMIN